MIYDTLLAVGAVGLVAQTVLGFAHAGGAGGGHGVHMHLHGHVHLNGHAHGHAHVHAGGGAARTENTPAATTHSQHGTSLGGARQAMNLLWTLFSPLTIFSICLGAGVAGLGAQALRQTATLTMIAAILGGLAFYGLIVRPMWHLIFRFASTPAESLAGVVAGEAEAMGRFDEQGRGIVRVNVDGQVVRLLAHLDAGDRAKATVAPGEKLVVTAVDGSKNTCTVTRL